MSIIIQLEWHERGVCLYINCYVWNIYLLWHVLKKTYLIIKSIIKILSTCLRTWKATFQFYVHKTRVLFMDNLLSHSSSLLM